MSIFGKKPKRRVMPVPEGFSPEDIRVEASVCTGERTVGFYSKAEKKLLHAELVRSNSDIREFYESYGLEPPEQR